MDRDGEKRYLLISHLDFRKTVLLYIKKIDHKSDHSPTSHIVWKWIDIDTHSTINVRVRPPLEVTVTQPPAGSSIHYNRGNGREGHCTALRWLFLTTPSIPTRTKHMSHHSVSLEEIPSFFAAKCPPS